MKSHYRIVKYFDTYNVYAGNERVWGPTLYRSIAKRHQVGLELLHRLVKYNEVKKVIPSLPGDIANICYQYAALKEIDLKDINESILDLIAMLDK